MSRAVAEFVESQSKDAAGVAPATSQYPLGPNWREDW